MLTVCVFARFSRIFGISVYRAFLMKNDGWLVKAPKLAFLEFDAGFVTEFPEGNHVELIDPTECSGFCTGDFPFDF